MLHFSTRHATLPAALLLIGLMQTANAQTYVTANTTIDGSFGFNNVVVGYANQSDLNSQANRKSPTVTIINSGSVANLNAYNSSTVNMNGGSAFSLTAVDNATIVVSGGGITSGLRAGGNSMVTVSGGNIAEGFTADGSSTLNLTGGSIFNDLYSSGSGKLNISGGSIHGNLHTANSSALNLYGMVTATLTNPNNNSNSQYTLSGTLSDGNSVNGVLLFIQNGSSARVAINGFAVPEPGSTALLISMGLTGAGLLARKRRK